METNELILTIVAGAVVIIAVITLVYYGVKYGGKEIEQRNKLINAKERQAKALEKIADYYSNLHI